MRLSSTMFLLASLLTLAISATINDVIEGRTSEEIASAAVKRQYFPEWNWKRSLLGDLIKEVVPASQPASPPPASPPPTEPQPAGPQPAVAYWKRAAIVLVGDSPL